MCHRKRREEAAKKREAEGRAPGWTANGETLSESSSDDDDDDDEGAPKAPKAPAAAAAAAPSSALAAKKKAAAAAPADDPADGSDPNALPKLKSMDIKKMNGDALKDALKARGLDVQGPKTTLMKRLTDYEAARS